MSERIILDPPEVADTDRTEIDITCWIDAEGVDWGDAEVIPYMSETRYGEVPVEHRVPNRQIQMPLNLRASGGTTMSEIRAALQRKVGLWQREGGWIERIRDGGGTVYADVVDAKFHATSWSGVQSRGSTDLEATLSLSCLPDFYGNEIQLLGGTASGEVTFTATGIQGDYPARMRMTIQDTSNENQVSLMYGIRSRTYSSDARAALVYEAEGNYFQPLNGGTAYANTGASGGTAIRDAALSTDWTTELRSVGGAGILLHEGMYRVFGRVDTSNNAETEWRLQWSIGDLSISPVTNTSQAMGTVSGWQIQDFGSVNLRPALAGTHCWQADFQAKAGTAGVSMQFDQVWYVPCEEGFGIVSLGIGERVLGGSNRAELRTEGYFFAGTTGGWAEAPIYGELPRLPVPVEGTGGTVQLFVRTSRGDMLSGGNDSNLDGLAINELYYRPCWLFLE